MPTTKHTFTHIIHLTTTKPTQTLDPFNDRQSVEEKKKKRNETKKKTKGRERKIIMKCEKKY